RAHLLVVDVGEARDVGDALQLGGALGRGHRGVPGDRAVLRVHREQVPTGAPEAPCLCCRSLASSCPPAVPTKMPPRATMPPAVLRIVSGGVTRWFTQRVLPSAALRP